MKIITERMLIRNVAKRWREQYEPFKNDTPLITNGKTKRQIAKELDNLDKETATADDIEKIIGNRSWTRLQCNECGREVKSVVEVGQEPDYESYTARLCETCAIKAASIFQITKQDVET